MTGSMRLLIVDHDPLTREHYLSPLRDAGYSCDFATSGAQAIERLSRNFHNIVIANSLTPGLEALHLPGSPGTSPCLLVFAPPGDEEPQENGLPGHCLCLRQPVSTATLFLAVECVLKCAEPIDRPLPHLDQAAILTHEFRSPLASMKTTAETLRKDYYGPLLPQQREAIESIERNCSYLDDAITCIVDLHELDGNTVISDREAINLAADVVAPILAKPEYRHNPKSMTLALAAEPVRVTGDPRLLRIVLNNLINNALKFGQPATTIQVRVYREGPYAIISVRNEGIGIPTADKGRLFRRFGRLRQPGSEGIKGSGLGLYLCRRIVELHDGSIDVDSESGKYAEFRVSFEAKPLAPVENRAEESLRSCPPATDAIEP
jgi:hypothetical protein